MSEYVSRPFESFESSNSPREQLVREALALIGTKSMRYKSAEFGMNPEEGFDCSGFVTHLLNKITFPKKRLAVQDGRWKKL